MKNVLLSLLATVLILTSCGGSNAIKFNDAIVKANTQLTLIYSSFENDVAQAIDEQQFAGIAIKADSALANINRELETVKNMEVPKGGESYKDVALKTCETLKSVVESGKDFSSLTTESSVEDINKMVEVYQGKTNEYQTVFNELVQAQADYAKEIGATVR